MEGHLLLKGKVEECLRRGKLARDKLCSNAVLRHIEEAGFPARAMDLARSFLLARAGEITDVNYGNRSRGLRR